MEDHGTPPSTSSLGLLAGYSGSSESEEDSREEAGPCSRREGGGRCLEEKFEIPSSIQGNFKVSTVLINPLPTIATCLYACI